MTTSGVKPRSTSAGSTSAALPSSPIDRATPSIGVAARPCRSPRRRLRCSRRGSSVARRFSIRDGSTSITSATPPFMVTASGWAPPIPPRPAVTTILSASVPSKCRRRDFGERFVGALEDALRADVDPAAGRHLPVHRQAAIFEIAERFPVRPLRDEVGVGDQHARRAGMRLEDADRLAGLHQQRLVVRQRLERADDRVVGVPRSRRLAGAAVDDQIVGTFGDVGIEIVHQHPQRGFLWPSQARQRRAAGRAE